MPNRPKSGTRLVERKRWVWFHFFMVVYRRESTDRLQFSDQGQVTDVQTTGKPKLGGAKTINKVDTDAYDDVLEDDDFM
jgi:hypothetical protein